MRTTEDAVTSQATVWRKSSRSMQGANNCVEVAAGTGGRPWAAVRDSKDPDGGVLLVSAAAFSAFVDAAGAGTLG